jgi:hypothetical protein
MTAALKNHAESLRAQGFNFRRAWTACVDWLISEQAASGLPAGLSAGEIKRAVRDAYAPKNPLWEEPPFERPDLKKTTRGYGNRRMVLDDPGIILAKYAERLGNLGHGLPRVQAALSSWYAYFRGNDFMPMDTTAIILPAWTKGRKALLSYTPPGAYAGAARAEEVSGLADWCLEMCLDEWLAVSRCLCFDSRLNRPPLGLPAIKAIVKKQYAGGIQWNTNSTP